MDVPVRMVGVPGIVSGGFPMPGGELLAGRGVRRPTPGPFCANSVLQLQDADDRVDVSRGIPVIVISFRA